MLCADRWQHVPRLHALCQDLPDGKNYLLLNLSETVLLEDRHLICFTDWQDAFGYSQLLRQNGDLTDFRCGTDLTKQTTRLPNLHFLAKRELNTLLKAP